MKVEDPEQALTEAVCSRVREQLNGSDAELAEAFARQLYRWVAPEDVAERDPLDLYGLALGHFNFARERPPGTPEGARLQPALRGARLAVHAHRRRDRDRRHAVPHRLGEHGAEPARLRGPPDHPPGPAGAPRRGRPSRSRSSRRARRSRRARSGSRSSTPRWRASPTRGGSRDIERHLERVIGEVRAAVEDWQAMREPRTRGGRRARATTTRRRPPSSSGSPPTTSPSSATATRTSLGSGSSASPQEQDLAEGLEPGTRAS